MEAKFCSPYTLQSYPRYISTERYERCEQQRTQQMFKINQERDQFVMSILLILRRFCWWHRKSDFREFM